MRVLRNSLNRKFNLKLIGIKFLIRSIWFFASLVLVAGGCFNNSTSSTNASKLDDLALKLSVKYKRDFGHNDFSLTYRADPPNTIILDVNTIPKTDLTRLKKVIEAAKENAVGIAQEDFNLKINTSVNQVQIREEDLKE